MLFVSLHPHISPTSSFSRIRIFSSLLPNPDNPTSLPIPIKAPTPPWMKAPLLLQPHELVDLSNPKNNKSKVEKHELSDKALMGKEARGKRFMKKIVKRVEKLRYKTRTSSETRIGSPNVENEDFGGVFESVEENEEEVRTNKGRMPWVKDDDKFGVVKIRREKVVTAAELTLDKVLLRRLRGEAAIMRTWIKVKKAGVTQDVVDQIKRTWRRNELVMIKFDIPLCRNMDRAREIVEVLACSYSSSGILLNC